MYIKVIKYKFIRVINHECKSASKYRQHLFGIFIISSTTAYYIHHKYLLTQSGS